MSPAASPKSPPSSARRDGNIDNIKMTNRVADYTEMVIDLEVWDLKHLNEILAGLRAKDVVSSAARVSG